jgi:hypothetical protein
MRSEENRMGLASRRSPNPQRAEVPASVGIIETIVMKESLAIAHAPGVVAVLESFPSADPQAFVGRTVQLQSPAGRVLAAQIEAVRDHGTTISFFFRGLTAADIPLGSRVEFND